MRKKKLLPIIICLALLISCLGVSEYWRTAIADETPGISDNTDTETPEVNDETATTTDLDQQTENNEAQDPEKVKEPVNTDSLPILEDDTELPLFMDQDTPATDAPMISVSVPTLVTPDGEEIELINNDLTLEEKNQYLRQGFSIQDIYMASEIAYNHVSDSKSVLEKVKIMAAEQKENGRIDSTKIGSAKINWDAVKKRVKKDEIKKLFDYVKGKYPEAVAEMTKEGIPAEIQLNIIAIQNIEKTAKVKDLVKEYKQQGKGTIMSKMEKLMENTKTITDGKE